MYAFANYKLRPAGEQDRALAAQWIEADPEHRGMSAEFFCQSEATAECFVLEDRWGEPVFFFRMERALRVHIQFGPATTDEQKARMAEGLVHGFGWLQQMATGAGFRELLFQSTVAPLIRFCGKRFGFKKSPNELVCGLAPANPQQGQGKAARAEQQIS